MDWILRTRKRYLPPFRIAYSRRRGGRGTKAPLVIRDARDVIVASFTKWPYAFACLEALHRQAGLVPPHPAITKRRFQQDLYTHRDKYPHSRVIQKYWNITAKYWDLNRSEFKIAAKDDFKSVKKIKPR
jgi:hypothetical protein